MEAKKYDKASVQKLLSALEEQAHEVLRLSQLAERGMAHNAFSEYMEFREKVSEFEVFSMIIDHRLKNMLEDAGDEGGGDRLQQQLDQLSALILSHLIGASIKFFSLIAGGQLPLGSRDIFISELKNLYTTKDKLDTAKYKSSLTEEASNNIRIAERILNEIIERAPSLLNFG